MANDWKGLVSDACDDARMWSRQEERTAIWLGKVLVIVWAACALVIVMSL